jgi:beta-glucosidase
MDRAGPLPEVSGLVGKLFPTGLYMVHGKAVGHLQMMMSGVSGQPRTVSSVPAQSADGALRIKGIDYKAQEDARLIQWKAPGGAFSLHADKPLDIKRQSDGDVMLVMTMRVDDVPASGKVTLGMTCAKGSPCKQVALPFRAALASLTHHQWMTVGLPLKCFHKAGADMTSIAAPFVLKSNAAMQLGLSKVQLASHADTVLPCPAH